MKPIVVYRHALSGHAHRVELFLALLDLPVQLVDVDLAAGAQKAPEFLKRNPFGQVPVIEDGDVTLADSNAILVYLALRYDKSGTWYPREPLAAAQAQQWLRSRRVSSRAARQCGLSSKCSARLSTTSDRPPSRCSCSACSMPRWLDKRS